jgi:serine/threonine protein phosphatase PrpC
LLCSDGLSKTLPEERLAELLSGDDATGAASLVMAALTAQATDNITAVTIDFSSGDGSAVMEAKTVGAPAVPPPEATAQSRPSTD